MPVSKRRKTAKKAAPTISTAQMLAEFKECPYIAFDVALTLAARKLLADADDTAENMARALAAGSWFKLGPPPDQYRGIRLAKFGIPFRILVDDDDRKLSVWLESEDTDDTKCPHCLAIVETAAYFAEPSPTVH